MTTFLVVGVIYIILFVLALSFVRGAAILNKQHDLIFSQHTTSDNGQCKCNICTRTRAFNSNIALISHQGVRDYVIELYDHMMHVEMDRDLYKSVIDGSWPNADQFIDTARKRHGEIKNEV